MFSTLFEVQNRLSILSHTRIFLVCFLDWAKLSSVRDDLLFPFIASSPFAIAMAVFFFYASNVKMKFLAVLSAFFGRCHPGPRSLVVASRRPFRAASNAAAVTTVVERAPKGTSKEPRPLCTSTSSMGHIGASLIKLVRDTCTICCIFFGDIF